MRRRVSGHELVDEILPDRGARLDVPVPAVRILTAGDRESGESRLGVVQRVGIALVLLKVARVRNPVVRREVVVDSPRRILTKLLRGRGVVEIEHIWIGPRLQRAGGGRGVDVGEQFRDRGIDGRGLAVGRRHREDVDRVAAVLEESLLRLRRHDPAGAGHLAWLAELLVVEEEERLVMAIVQARELNGSAEADPGLIDLHEILRRLARRWIGIAIAVVEPVVRVPPWIAIVEVGAAGVAVRPRSSGELDLDRTLTG